MRFIRMAQKLEEAFFKSQVTAEMMKSVTYSSPTAHCKHIGATLFALTVFAEDGKPYASEATCTQVDMPTYRLPCHMCIYM